MRAPTFLSGLVCLLSIGAVAAAADKDSAGDPLPKGAVSRLGTTRLFPGTFGLPVFTPDSKAVVTCDQKGVLHFWDVTSGKEVRTLPPAVTEDAQQQGLLIPNQFAVTADGTRVVSSHGSLQIHVRDAATGKLVRKVDDAESGCRFFAPSADGKLLVFAPNGKEYHTLAVLDVETGKRLPAFAPNGDKPNQLAYYLGSGVAQCAVVAPDAATAAAGMDDGSVRVWDIKTGKQTLSIDGHRSTVLGVAFAPDGKTLASVGSDEHVRLWKAASGEAIREWEVKGVRGRGPPPPARGCYAQAPARGGYGRGRPTPATKCGSAARTSPRTPSRRTPTSPRRSTP